jgi:hypothetical protein
MELVSFDVKSLFTNVKKKTSIPYAIQYGTFHSKRVTFISDPYFLSRNLKFYRLTIRKIIKSYEYFRPIGTVSFSTRKRRGFSCLIYIEGFTDKITRNILKMNSGIKCGYKIPNKTSKIFTNTKSFFFV